MMELLCGKCGNMLTVDEAQAGRTCLCPRCGRTIHVPALDDSHTPSGEHRPDESVSDDGGEEGFLTKAKLLLQRKVLVICGSCGERLTVEQRLAGRVLRCPACGGQIHIPLQRDEESFPQVETRMEVLDITAEDSLAPGETAEYPTAETDEDAGSGGRWTLAIVLIVMTGLAGVVIGYILRGRGDDKPPSDGPAISAVPDRPRPVPATQPIARPTTKPIAVVKTRPVIAPVKPQAAVKILQVKTEVLAQDIAPAPPGKKFLYATAKILAGQTAVKINTAEDVMLDCDSDRIFPLGLTVTDSIVSPSARQGTIDVEPSATRIETFVFLVDEGLIGGKLTITGAGEAELPALPAFSAPVPSTVIGEYVEYGRYLRLAFENPIMEQLRAGGVHGLVIAERGELFTIALPPTGLRGWASSAGNGAFTAAISDGKNRLQCRLRLIDAGKRLILYLSEKPYHQIIYKRK
ncbi:MAG: hypothetical protein SVV80_02285 [Planctomycetota bacterium]|nr:hypothetical protein [Planctomycetota bacterium]